MTEKIVFGTPIDWYSNIVEIKNDTKTNKPSEKDKTKTFWFIKNNGITECMDLEQNLRIFKEYSVPFNIETQIGNIKITQDVLEQMNKNVL